MDITTDNERTQSNSPVPSSHTFLINEMKFVEVFPLDRTHRPHPRSGHRAVATDSDLWIWGGFHPSVNGEPHMFNEVERKKRFAMI